MKWIAVLPVVLLLSACCCTNDTVEYQQVMVVPQPAPVVTVSGACESYTCRLNPCSTCGLNSTNTVSTVAWY